MDVSMAMSMVLGVTVVVLVINRAVAINQTPYHVAHELRKFSLAISVVPTILALKMYVTFVPLGSCVINSYPEVHCKLIKISI